MIFRNYLPHSTGYTNHSSLTKFPGVDSGLKLPGTTASAFQGFPSKLSGTSLINFPNSSVVLPEIIKTSSYVSPNPREYPDSWKLDSKDLETEKPWHIKTVTDPIYNWFKSITKGDVINFVLDNAPDAYATFTDIHNKLKTQAYSHSPNDIFYNTSASERFNGGIGNDTVVYSGKHSDYRIVPTSEYPLGNHSGYKVIGKNGKEVDTLISIEQLKFSDGYSDLGIIGSTEVFHPLV